MEQQHIGAPKLMEFPHLSDPHRALMVHLITSIETRLSSQLLPSAVPPDVQYYQNQTGASQGTLHIRSGLPSSLIDFYLASWLHLELPNGGALNITNVQGYLKPSTDAPHFQFELVQCSPSFFIFFLDITPRKDLVLHPDYLEIFYQNTKLEEIRQKLDKLPETRPYFSSSLYFRGVVSPTGILVGIEGEAERMVEIIRDYVAPASKEVLEMWLEKCARDVREVAEHERGVLRTRDLLIKTKAIEMDLSSSMPRQFGQEVADRVLAVIRKAFNS